MSKQRATTFLAAACLALAAHFSPALAETTELRVLVHSSFSLPKPLLAKFEDEAKIKLSLINAGSAGEMLNKMILTRAQPIADVVFGIDNTLLAKARATQVIAPDAGVAQQESQQESQQEPPVTLGPDVVAIDYGFVTLNYDKAAFAKSALPLPASLADLTLPAYRDLLVVENPATSSLGHAFLLATIAGLGETAAFDWWAKMRANGVKVVKGWSEAYYTEFSRNGGSRPLVVSYSTSPAAEVFYSKEKIDEAPTGNVFLEGGVFRQIEGVALIEGGKQPHAGARFVEFLRSPAVQEALQTSMWMFPATPGVAHIEAMRHAEEPATFETLSPETIGEKDSDWVSRWTRVVLK